MTTDYPLVHCKDVVVGYDPGSPVLEGVDLRIEQGEIVTLLGSSGCGKSTLLRTITGLLPPLSGEVFLLGQPLYGIPDEQRDQLLRRTGMLFQQDALFGATTVLENVALPLRECTSLPDSIIKEMAMMKLAVVGLGGLEQRYPSQMSGGQRKRAALARASILDPEIIFCDEPSAGLDPVVAAGIDETLLQFRKIFGISIVAVTHELESIRTIADRAVMLADGVICATGTIPELSASTDETVYNFFHRIAVDRGDKKRRRPARSVVPA